MRVPGSRPAPLFLLLLVACDNQPPTAPVDSGSMPPPALSKEVPMRGRYEGTGVFAGPPASCAGFYSVFNGVGQESHTGAYTLHHTTCTVPIDATHSSFTGEFTKAAANGDLLFGTYEGTTELTEAPGVGSPIGVFAIAGTITFAGGTGRFEGASGSEQMEGTQWTDFSQAGFPSRLVLEFEGTISSVGSLH